MPFVREVAGVPQTAQWRKGVKVRGNNVPTGTAIATFDRTGKYENDRTGRSHAAILIEENVAGLRVYDQWVGRSVHERTIRWKNGNGKPANDGDAYHVVTVMA